MAATNLKNLRNSIGVAVFLSAIWFAPAQAQDGYYSELPASQIPANLSDTDLMQSGEAPDQLQPGEFEWLPTAQRDNGEPVMVVVSIRDQRAYVYRGSERIAVTTVSTGKPGNETPTGVFPILQKKKVHHSNLYDDAPMPFMQRLTWDGIALHAGKIPGKPASHGCVRLPKEFARQLFDVTKHGQTVVVSEDGSVDALARAGLSPSLALLVGAASSIRDIVNTVGSPVSATTSGSGGGNSTMDVAYERSNTASFSNQQ